MSSRPPNLAIVGVTGAVGREMLAILEQRRTRHADLRLLASPRSAGQTLAYRGEQRPVEALGPDSLRGVDVALFSAGSGVSKQFAPAARAAGTLVIDNSSAFRDDPACPLVIPEVNPGALDGVRGRPAIVANPNCSAIILLVALEPLRRALGLRRLVVATYQAVSGAGAQAMDELLAQTREVLAGREARPRVFHEPCAFNLFSHNAPVDPASGSNGEELKMVSESRRIWTSAPAPPDAAGAPALTATCVRVPVLRAHAQAVNVTLANPASERRVREVLERAQREGRGVRLVDDRAANRFPTPLKASGADDVLIGRLRPDRSQTGGEAPLGPEEPTPGFDLFIAGDQLRKGAALNAIQIAEDLLPALRA